MCLTSGSTIRHVPDLREHYSTCAWEHYSTCAWPEEALVNMCLNSWSTTQHVPDLREPYSIFGSPEKAMFNQCLTSRSTPQPDLDLRQHYSTCAWLVTTYPALSPQLVRCYQVTSDKSDRASSSSKWFTGALITVLSKSVLNICTENLAPIL